MLRGLVSMVPGWGTETYTIRAPYSGEVLRLAGLAISAEQLAVIVMTLALCTALYLYFRFTRLGVAMQAASQNQLAAYYMGIPVARVNSLVWAISAAVAGFAGVLLAPITFVHVNMGFIGLKAFPAAVIGGFGSVPGRDRRRPHHRRRRVARRVLPARRLQGRRRLHRRAARAHGSAARTVRRAAAQEGLTRGPDAIRLQDQLRPGHPPLPARRPVVLVRPARARAASPRRRSCPSTTSRSSPSSASTGWSAWA